MRRGGLGALVGAVAILSAASTADFALAQSRQSYGAQLTSDRPGSPTGFEQTIRYANPEAPDGKPFAVAEIAFSLPPGAVIDTSAPARCGAADAAFQLEGADACPPGTQVGTGSLSLDFGAGMDPVPRVVENGVTFFNAEDELILFSESTNTGEPPIRNASRVEVVDGRTFVSRVPPLPAAPPPDPFAAVKEVTNRLGAREAYITTPPTCPAGGQWVITARFTYRDGVVETARSTTPCVARRATSPGARGPVERDRADDRPAERERSAAPKDGPERPGGGPPEDRARTDTRQGSASVASGGEQLPFTGLPLSGLLVAGGGLLAGGLMLRRLAAQRRA